MDSTIQTYTGKFVNPANLSVDDIDIKDIAHALSLTCRFGGHSLGHYSVAEHSVRVERAMGDRHPRILLSALLHDAAEAYLGDMVGPVKHGGDMASYLAMERRAEQVIADKYRLYFPELASIKQADRKILLWEKAWVHRFDEGWSAKEAEDIFLDEYLQIEELLYEQGRNYGNG